MLHVVVLFVLFLTLWYVAFVWSGRMDPLTSHRDAAEDHERARRAMLRDRRKRRLVRDATRPVDIADATPNTNDPVDCAVTERLCVSDADCSILCRQYKRLFMRCDANDVGGGHTCRPSYIFEKSEDKSDGDGGDDRPCDVSKGEYAMLVGYTILGAAIWQCVQIYRHLQDRSKYCEGGEFDMRADVREPSYRDCRCPDGTVRAIYRHPTAYESVATTSLPHCIPNKAWRLYSASMIATDGDDDDQPPAT